MSGKDRRPTLFLSSTSIDLADYRKVVVHVCQRLGIHLVVMEDFGPDPRTAAAVCRERVRNADLFLGLYAHRYGHTPDGFGGKSITELEYDWAREMGIPVLLFLVDEEIPWPPKHVDKSERLAQFKARVRAQHVVSTLATPEEFKDDLFVHLPKFRDQVGDRPRPADEIPTPPEPYIAHRYTLLQTGQVIGREAELTSLDAWAGDPAARVFCIVAIGGMGKSALTWKWFHDRAPQAMAPLAGRIWWSFYETDAGFDRFVTAALAYCSGRSPESLETLSPTDREHQLLAILDRQPFLIVLDGFERLLIAYASLDFAHLADEELDERTAHAVDGALFTGQHRLRKTIDHRVGNFLRKLAGVRAARILVTTRLYPSELQTVTGQPLPGTAAWFLRGMDRGDALALWRAMGVSGSDAELGKLFATIEHYPLLLRALAGEIAEYRRAPGDFDAWRGAHPDFDPFSLPLVQAKSHVLAHALGDLGLDARELLHTIAAFRSPVDYDTLTALFVQRLSWPPRRLDALLTQLEDRGLVGWDRRNNRYDLHPIVRGVVWSGLDQGTRREVYGTLERHFAAVPTRGERVDTLEEATTVMELFNALVGLGRYEDAAELYFNRFITGGGTFTFVGTGLTHRNIALLESLFGDGLEKAPSLGAANSTDVLSGLGYAYGATGRLTDARSFLRRARALEERPNVGTARNLSWVALLSGRLREAVAEARLALESWRDHTVGFGFLAQCEIVMGSLAQARARLESKTSPGWDADHLAAIDLREGNHPAAARAAERIVTTTSYVTLRLKMNALWGEARMNLGEIDEAGALLVKGLGESRNHSLVESELEHLRILAELHRRLRKHEQARAFLDDLWDPAARGPYRLIQADAYNVLSEIERDGGNRDAAIAAAQEAYRRAWCDGPPYSYHWALEHARKLLRELGAPEPLPPSD